MNTLDLKVLLSAAPNLLLACEVALALFDRDGLRPLLGMAFTDTDLDILRHAIAKAKGPNP